MLIDMLRTGNIFYLHKNAQIHRYVHIYTLRCVHVCIPKLVAD